MALSFGQPSTRMTWRTVHHNTVTEQQCIYFVIGISEVRILGRGSTAFWWTRSPSHSWKHSCIHTKLSFTRQWQEWSGSTALILCWPRRPTWRP